MVKFDERDEIVQLLFDLFMEQRTLVISSDAELAQLIFKKHGKVVDPEVIAAAKEFLVLSKVLPRPHTKRLSRREQEKYPHHPELFERDDVK